MYAEASNVIKVKLHGDSEGYEDILEVLKRYNYLDGDIDLDAFCSGLDIVYVRYDLKGDVE